MATGLQYKLDLSAAMSVREEGLISRQETNSRLIGEMRVKGGRRGNAGLMDRRSHGANTCFGLAQDIDTDVMCSERAAAELQRRQRP